MGSTTGRIRRRSLLGGFAVTAAMGALAVGAPAALADNVGITLNGSSAEQGMPVNVTLAGSAPAAIDQDGDGPFLYAIDRPADGTGCQATFGADQDLEGDNSDILEDGTELDPGVPFSVQDQIDPDLGPYIVCAWIETDGDDGDDVVTSSEVTAGPISASFTAAGPHVGPIKVTVPAKINVGQTYTIKYATTTDQDLDLASVVIPAASGPCADSYEDEDASTLNDIFDGATDVDGNDTNSGTDSEAKAGNYLICSWIEGPDDSQIDVTQTTKISVVAAGTSSSSGKSASGSSTSAPKSGNPGATRSGGSSTAATGSGHAGSMCTVPRLSGMTLKAAKQRLLDSGCGVGVIYHVVTHKVQAGRVVKLADAPGSQLKHGSAVAITIAHR